MRKIFLVFTLVFSCLFSQAQFNRTHDNSNSDNNSNNTNNSHSNYNSSADDDDFVKGFDKSKIIYGGSVDAGFYNGWSVFLVPEVGYKVAKKIGVGIAGSIYYSSFHGYVLDNFGNSVYANTDMQSYGIGFWAKAILFRNIFAKVIYEENMIKQDVQATGYTSLGTFQLYPSFLVGLGFRQRIGAKTFLNASFYYDVLQQNPIYYGTIVPRFGFSYGL
jgi:hypothetical protein